MDQGHLFYICRRQQSGQSSLCGLRQRAAAWRGPASGQNYRQADSVYSLLKHSTNGDYSGEASYRIAESLFLQQQYDEAERAIEAITADPANDYYLAKSFILWADIFYARGNNLQAKQTLQSIIDNYDGDDLVQLALQKRNNILEEENPPQQPEDEEIVIELESETSEQ